MWEVYFDYNLGCRKFEADYSEFSINKLTTALIRSAAIVSEAVLKTNQLLDKETLCVLTGFLDDIRNAKIKDERDSIA